MNIHFHFADATITLKERKRLKNFLLQLFKKERTKLRSLQYIFCSDEYLLNFNRQFLQHDYYTDIITFNLCSDKETVEGELYISIDRVKDNAKTLDVSTKEELHRVIFHGALHLCGYRDKTKKDVIEMRKMEDKYLSLYFK